MQAGVSNQVERVLGLYERKRRAVLSEIDEKPERPHGPVATQASADVIRFLFVFE